MRGNKTIKKIAVIIPAFFLLTGCTMSIGPIKLIEPMETTQATNPQQKEQLGSEYGKIIIDDTNKSSIIKGADPNKDDDSSLSSNEEMGEEDLLNDTEERDSLNPNNESNKSSVLSPSINNDREENNSSTKENFDNPNLGSETINPSDEENVVKPLPRADDPLVSQPSEKQEVTDAFIYTEEEYRFVEIGRYTGYVTKPTTLSAAVTFAVDNIVLEKGDMVSVYGASTDGSYLMVEVGGRTKMFVTSDRISKNEIKKDIPKPEPPQPQETGEIVFPSNAKKLFAYANVTFAESNFKATVLENLRVSSGPGAISNSTGYYELGTYAAGGTVNVTAIGKNGYVAIKLPNNAIGFVDARYLSK